MRRRTKEGRNNSDEKNKSKNIREEGGIHMGTKTITAAEIIERINEYNSKCGRKPLDSKYIEGKINKREMGESFSLDNYVEAMIYSFLSSGTVWQKISGNKEKISEIFGGFSASYLEKQEPEKLLKDLKNIKCCGQNTKKQMCALKGNIDTLKRIEADHGTIDNYVNSILEKNETGNISISSKIELIKNFAYKESNYKLQQMEVPLACEFIRNVGIDTLKPDRHVCRIVGNEYLNLLSPKLAQQIEKKKDLNPNDRLDIVKELEEYAKKSNVKPYILDLLLWDYCAKGHDNAGVCQKGSQNCKACVFQDICQKKNKFWS